MPSLTYVACIGTRPEIIKMVPVYYALKDRGKKVCVVHTGQHEAVAVELYRFFDMKPDVVIDLKRKSAALSSLTATLLDGVEHALNVLQPDVVMVQGDTTSALVGAVVGYYHNKPVAHVEAGLRTREREPFPEEKNRELIGRLAYWHFAPTSQAGENLRHEGIEADRIFEVGNTVIDAAIWTRSHITHKNYDATNSMPPDLRAFLREQADTRKILITAHRRENWGVPIRNIAKAVARIVALYPDVSAIWPIHPNPAVRANVQSELDQVAPAVLKRICLTQHVNYSTMIHLLDLCVFTLTDSGGIQEEASAFAKPVLIARNSTERQELVKAGGAVLVGTDVECIMRHVKSLLTDATIYRSMQVFQSPFGDGQSANRIADVLIQEETKPVY